MLISHKIALSPNNQQKTYFAKASGVARFAYNWALSEWKKQYEMGLKPTEAALRRELNRIKREQFPWMLEVTKNAPQMAIIHLGKAFQNFFAGRAKYPQFKKKGIHDGFHVTNDQFKLEGKRIKLPHLGWVKMTEALRFSGKVISASLSRLADRWFVGITVDTEIPISISENQAVVGVDLGISRLATLSTGEVFVGPKPHRALLSRVKRLSRSLSRKKKGSNNRAKAKLKLSRLHAGIKHIRENALHQLTTQITRRFSHIVVEDLNVQGMMQNRCLARAIGDMGFFEFRRQLAYKSKMHGGDVQVADRFFPSSKQCSVCGEKNGTLTLSMRDWICQFCGAAHDRDLNVARNLALLAASSAV